MLSLVSAGLLFAATAVQAGPSTVTCNSNTKWLWNNDGIDPCAIWAQMLSVCDSTATVQPLSQSGPPYKYPAASDSTNKCNCNEDAYKLMASCVYCQGSSNSWPTLSQWNANCPEYDNFWFSAPGFDINSSAALDVDQALPPSTKYYFVSGTWDPRQACLASDAVYTTCNAMFPTGTSNSNSSSGGSGSGSGYPGPVNGGPIDDPLDDGVAAGVTVLVVVLVVCAALPAIGSIIGLIVFCVRQKNRRQFYQPLAQYYRNGGLPPGASAAPTLGYAAPTPGYAAPTPGYFNDGKAL